MYDVIIIGLGGMGSAIAMHLATRKKRVLGLEQFTPVHDRGSSHGRTRIIRQAYYEDPAYVPLLLRAYELWADLEKTTGRRLYLRTGGLMVGRPESALVRGSERSAQDHNLAHEMLDAAQIRRRFPATSPRDDEIALFELPAGVLFPEACVGAHLKRAVEAGAELRFETPVTSWRATNFGVEVTTLSGEMFSAEHLVLSAGAWFANVATELSLPLRVERNVMHWFEPSAHAQWFAPEHLPVYIVDRGEPMLYGFPAIDASGVKAAFHHSKVYTTAQALERTVAQAEVEEVRDALVRWLPFAGGAHLESVVCMYVLTPDEHFMIGPHPHHPQVMLAGGFSGHGFKFCGVVGEIIADLVTAGTTKHPIALFSPQRFTAAGAMQKGTT